MDTGGTFTDCLGKGPDGEVRVKVLSRGSLSAQVVQMVSDREILLDSETDWPEDFPRGFVISSGAKNQPEIKVEHWSSRENILILSDEPTTRFLEGEAIQLFSGWEAPLLAMRLILAREKMSQADCQIKMRLATTRCTNALLEDSGEKPVLFLVSHGLFGGANPARHHRIRNFADIQPHPKPSGDDRSRHRLPVRWSCHAGSWRFGAAGH